MGGGIARMMGARSIRGIETAAAQLFVGAAFFPIGMLIAAAGFGRNPHDGLGLLLYLGGGAISAAGIGLLVTA